MAEVQNVMEAQEVGIQSLEVGGVDSVIESQEEIGIQAPEMAGVENVIESGDEVLGKTTSKLQDLCAKGDTLSKAWSDLFSFITDFQTELTLKEKGLDIAEMEIDSRKQQLEGARLVAEAGEDEMSTLQETIQTKERFLCEAKAELAQKESLLQTVRMQLRQSQELNKKSRADFLRKNAELLGCKNRMERIKTELTLKIEELEKKGGSSSKSEQRLTRENEDLKEQLEMERTMLALERKALELERKSHEMTKRNLKKSSQESLETLETSQFDSDNESIGAADDTSDHSYMQPKNTPKKKQATPAALGRPLSQRRSGRVPKQTEKAKAFTETAPTSSPRGVKRVSTDPSEGLSILSKIRAVQAVSPKATGETADGTANESEVYFPLTLNLKSVKEDASGGVDNDIEEEEEAEEAAAVRTIKVEQLPDTPSQAKTPKFLKDDFELDESKIKMFTPRRFWTEDDMAKAVKEVSDGSMTRRQAADHYGIPSSSIFGRVRKLRAKQRPARKSLEPEEGEKTCTICEIDIPAASYMEHMLSHKKPFRCLVCKERFATKAGVVKHIRCKHEGKPAVPAHRPIGKRCDICKEIIKDRFKEHMQRHEGEKPYKCNICGDAFFRNYSLSCHLRRHLCTKAKPHLCTHCRETFQYKEDLKEHVELNHHYNKP